MNIHHEQRLLPPFGLYAKAREQDRIRVPAMKNVLRHTLFALLALCVAALAACSPEELDFSVDDLPSGDPARGADLFVQPVDGGSSCLSCHPVSAGQSAGPPLQGYGDTASQRVKQQSAEEYTFYSILRPSRHIVQGYSNTMPSDYAKKLSRQVIADLIAYLLSL